MLSDGDATTYEWRRRLSVPIQMIKKLEFHRLDFSMTLSPAKSLSVSSAEEFLSEIESSIIGPRNLTGLEWIEGIGDETSGWTYVFETEKGVVFIDLTLTMTIEHDLSALHSRPAQVKAAMHRESKVWAPETLVVIRFKSSMKARSKGNVVLLVVNLGTMVCIEYPSMLFIPAKKRITERVQPGKIPCWCLCQALQSWL